MKGFPLHNLHVPSLTYCLGCGAEHKASLTAATKSIISTRGRAISQQGHQEAAAEIALFIYFFFQRDSVIYKLNE